MLLTGQMGMCYTKFRKLIKKKEGIKCCTERNQR
ncbi:hypothetical protein [Brochothrix phage ADU4]|nr:hypothetical protein [Brochothrix phage ADU4]